MKLITTLLLTPLLYSTCLAQGSIMFVDGRKVECSFIDYTTDSSKVKYTLTNKTKVRTSPKDQLFSYTPVMKNEIVFYTPDTLAESEVETFNERQMRMYIIGQQDARAHYKTTVSVIGGAVCGGIGGYFLPALLSPLGAVPFVAVNGLLFNKVNRKKVYNRLYLAEETYLMGYQKVARGKRVQQGIVAGLAGALVGIVVRAVLPPKN
jgi:hypothetical protein